MSVYKPKNSPNYQYDFQIGGQRFHGTTGCTNEREARGVERQQREKAKAAVKAAKAASGGPLTIDDASARYWREVGERHANAETTWTDLGRLVDYFTPQKPLTDITDDDVAKLVHWRRTQPAWGRTTTKAGEPMRLVSAATVNRSTGAKEDIHACEADVAVQLSRRAELARSLACRAERARPGTSRQ